MPSQGIPVHSTRPGLLLRFIANLFIVNIDNARHRHRHTFTDKLPPTALCACLILLEPPRHTPTHTHTLAHIKWLLTLLLLRMLEGPSTAAAAAAAPIVVHYKCNKMWKDIIVHTSPGWQTEDSSHRAIELCQQESSKNALHLYNSTMYDKSLRVELQISRNSGSNPKQ